MMGPMEFGVVLLLIVLTFGPAGLLLAAAASPLGPLLRYAMCGLFAFSIAAALAGVLGGGMRF